MLVYYDMINSWYFNS